MPLEMVRTAESGDGGALADAARAGRAAAMSWRRALSAGRAALSPRQRVVRTQLRVAGRDAPGPEAPAAAAPTGHAATSGARADLTETTVTAADVAAARLGRILSMQRRRQLSKGKQALIGDGARQLVVHRGGAR